MSNGTPSSSSGPSVAGLVIVVVAAALVLLAVVGLFLSRRKSPTSGSINTPEGTVTWTSDGREAVTVTQKGPKGTVTYRAGSEVQTPSWLPIYPGAKTEASVAAEGPQAGGTTLLLVTSDGAEQVMKFYEDALKKVGLEVSSHTATQNGRLAGGSLIGKDAANKREVLIGVVPTDEGTRVNVTYR
jgi:hypothetical protein